ncbi:MAG: hypothetical protein HXY47_06520 [Nitrospirae bacterium]|nr:hypothetical protein [Nitrospirota bacterium]
MKKYCIGSTIILPHIRYVNSEGRKGGLMFHSQTIRINGKYRTVGCNSMDSSGFCSGHEMSREEFLKKYCGDLDYKDKEDLN